MGIEEDKAELIAAAIVTDKARLFSDEAVPMMVDDFAFGARDINGNLIGENLVTPSEVEAALNLLAVKGIIIHRPSEYAKTRWMFDAAKIVQYRIEQMQDESSFEYRIAELGDEWVNECLINMRDMKERQYAPASDRFVSLDDNRETAGSVAELAVQLSEEIPESNTLSEVLPEKEDREALAQEIKNLSETVRLPRALKAPLEALLGVLRKIFEKVVDGGFKALGLQLLKGLAKLLGLDWFE